MINGEGTRCTLFVSGCIHQCKGCYNQSTWSINAGKLFDKQLADQIIKDLNEQRIKRQGLTLSGGDPLHPDNVDEVLKLLQRVKKECIDKDIWMWTGYVLAELNSRQKKIIELVDVLIDGKYEQKLSNSSLIWRGSVNQVIHDFRGQHK